MAVETATYIWLDPFENHTYHINTYSSLIFKSMYAFYVLAMTTNGKIQIHAHRVFQPDKKLCTTFHCILVLLIRTVDLNKVIKISVRAMSKRFLYNFTIITDYTYKLHLPDLSDFCHKNNSIWMHGNRKATLNKIASLAQWIVMKCWWLLRLIGSQFTMHFWPNATVHRMVTNAI